MDADELKRLCELSIQFLEQGNVTQARKVMHKAWEMNPDDNDACTMLARLRQEEVRQLQARYGHSNKVLFWIRGYFLSFFAPLILRFPPDSIDIYITLKDGWGVGELESLRERGYRFCDVLPRDEWWKYKALIMDHSGDYIYGNNHVNCPPVIAYIVHSTAYVPGNTKQPFLSHILFPFEAMAREQQPRFPWMQCGWGGPMQVDDADLLRMRTHPGELRKELFKFLGISHARGPVLACYSSNIDNPLELAQGLRQLAEVVHEKHGVVILKPFPTDALRFTKLDLGRVILWPGVGAGGNLLRLSADVVLTGLATSTLLTTMLLGKKILPYHTELEQKGIEREWNDMDLFPRFTYNPEKNLRGWKAIQLMGGTSSIADTHSLWPRLEALLDDRTYVTRAEKMSHLILGESDTRTPVDCTYRMIQHLLEHGRFPAQRCCG